MQEFLEKDQQSRAFPMSASMIEGGHGYPPQPQTKKKTQRSSSFRRFLRHPVALLLCALAGAAAGVLVNLAARPVYRARTSLDIQSLNSNSIDSKEGAPTGDEGSAGTEAYVQMQIKLLQSDTLLGNTVRALEAQPHPVYIERDDVFWRILSRVLSRVGDTGLAAPIPYSMLLHNAAQHTEVKQLRPTRLIEITCDSWNADLSARFCNTLTDTFRADEFAAGATEANRTNEWLAGQVAAVLAQAKESEHKLEAATAGNGSAPGTQKVSVSDGRLSQLQQELVQAHADRAQKQAAFVASINATIHSLPVGAESPTLRQYQQQLADLNNKVAQMGSLAEDNPNLIHLRAQVAEVQGKIDQLRKAIVGRARDEYATAKHREDLLDITYQTKEANTSSQADKASNVKLLQSEVDSEQQLYQTLLQRSRGAGLALAMRVKTIRVVDAAEAPKAAVSPRRGVAIGAGLLVGSLFAAGFAFYKERSSGTIRLPGEMLSRLNVQELGVIPSMGYEGRQGSTASRSLQPSRPGSRGTMPLSILASATSGATSLQMWSEPSSVVAEAYRNTAFSILLANRVLGVANMYIISSPGAGEGKTTVVSNLGVALSQSQRRVVIVDGDLRKPALHQALGVPNTTGVRNLLRGEINVATCLLDAFCQRTSTSNLSIVTSGSGNEEVTELLHSPHAAALLERLGEEFDLVLIDTPPMLHMADARIFADRTDGVILVFRAGITTVEQAEAAHQIFVHDRVRVLGTILNDFDPSREGKDGYYKSYYDYRDAVTPTGDEARV